MKKRDSGFPGHLRVRTASAEERQGIADFFAGSDHAGWVEETLVSARARALVVERFAEGTWVPLGCTVRFPCS